MRNKTARVATKFLKKSSQNLSLHVYDFDWTLFKSPPKPIWWEDEKYGEWESEAISLGSPFIPDFPQSARHWIPQTVKEAEKSISSQNTWAILCTAREDNGGLRYRIAEILSARNLDFDEVFLRERHLETIEYKVSVLLKKINTLKNVTSVHLWEDNQQNINAYKEVCQSLEMPFYGHLVNIEPPTQGLLEEDYKWFIEQKPMNIYRFQQYLYLLFLTSMLNTMQTNITQKGLLMRKLITITLIFVLASCGKDKETSSTTSDMGMAGSSAGAEMMGGESVEAGSEMGGESTEAGTEMGGESVEAGTEMGGESTEAGAEMSDMSMAGTEMSDMGVSGGSMGGEEG